MANSQGWESESETGEKKSVHGPSPLQGVDEPGPKSGSNWTSGLCFLLTQEHGADSKLLLICLGLYT